MSDAATVWEGPSGTIPVVNAAGLVFEEVQVATAAQTVFTLVGFQYTPNTHSIFVFRKSAGIGGQMLRRAVDYTETSTSVITLAAGATVGDLLYFVAFAISQITPTYANNGVPAGGTIGQFLRKSSGSDYALEWFSLSALTSLLDSARSNIASASTVNLTALAATTRNIAITGVIQIDGFQITNGQLWAAKFTGALTLKNNASIVTNSGYDIKITPGDTCFIRATADNVVEILAFSSAGASLNKNYNEFRLTLTSGTPVTIVDLSSSTIYCTPYQGNKISLYNGTSWVVRQSAEFSIGLAGLTVGLPYDLFAYDSAGAPTLEITAWTNITTRASALTTQDGVLVKQSDPTRKYMGSFVATVANGTADTERQRLLWNNYNRVIRELRRQDPAATWAYTINAVRQANANVLNQIEVCVGWPEDSIEVTLSVGVSNSAAGGAANFTSAIGLNSVVGAATGNRISAVTNTGANFNCMNYSEYHGILAVGYYYFSWLEQSTAAGVSTWQGANNSQLSGLWKC